jgi:cell division protein FtsB
VSPTARLTTAVLTGAVLYGIFGGEYGTLDWLALRRDEQEERAAIARLTEEVDSLRRYARQLQTDRKLLERLARENFGMIREGEYLYRIETDNLDGE